MPRVVGFLVLLLSGCTMSQFKCFMAYGPTKQSNTRVVAVNGASYVVTTTQSIPISGPTGAWAEECPAQHYGMLLRSVKTPADYARINAEMDRWRCENGWDKPAPLDRPNFAEEWEAFCASLAPSSQKIARKLFQ